MDGLRNINIVPFRRNFNLFFSLPLGQGIRFVGKITLNWKISDPNFSISTVLKTTFPIVEA